MRKAEERAYSICNSTSYFYRNRCMLVEIKQQDALCRKAAKLNQSLLTLARMDVANDICQGVAPSAWDQEGSVDLAAKVFELCLDEQITLFQQ